MVWVGNRPRRRGVVTLAVAAATAAAVLAGCGSSSGKSGTSTNGAGATGSASTGKPALFSELPRDIQQSGVIRDGFDATYPPLEYLQPDGKTYTGVDYDLAQALGKVLGVRIDYLNSAFGTLIPTLQAKRVDMVLSFATVTKEREQTVDFVQYSQSGTGLLVKKGNPQGITGLDSLCGKSVGLQAGAVQVPIAQAASAACTKAGKPAITIIQQGKDSQVQLLLRSGRIAADMLDAPVAAYSASINDQVEVVPNANYEVRPHGIMVLKGNTQLENVLFKAMQQLMSDGTYTNILQKYHVTNLALPAPKINGATS